MPVTRVQLFVEHTENNKNLLLPDSAWRPTATCVQVMPDDHSKSVPPLPIPNRTVKRLCADDSAATSVKVGYRQASYMRKPVQLILDGLFALRRRSVKLGPGLRRGDVVLGVAIAFELTPVL